MGSTYFATNVIQAITAIEWLASRHLPFLTDELAVELEVSRDTARRVLRTMEVKGWVTDAGKREQEDGRGWSSKVYRSNVRIRRINASASAS